MGVLDAENISQAEYLSRRRRLVAIHERLKTRKPIVEQLRGRLELSKRMGTGTNTTEATLVELFDAVELLVESELPESLRG